MVAAGPYSASASATATSTLGALSTKHRSITSAGRPWLTNPHARSAPHLGQFLKLPLVHHEVIRALNALDEGLEIRVLAEQLLELRAADALREASQR